MLECIKANFIMIMDIVEKQFFVEIAERHFGKEESEYGKI